MGISSSEENVLASRFALCKFQGTCHSTAMKPSVGVHAEGLPSEFLEFGRFLDGFEKRK